LNKFLLKIQVREGGMFEKLLYKMEKNPKTSENHFFKFLVTCTKEGVKYLLFLQGTEQYVHH